MKRFAIAAAVVVLLVVAAATAYEYGLENPPFDDGDWLQHMTRDGLL